MPKYKISKAVDELALECKKLMDEIKLAELSLKQKKKWYEEKKEQLMNAVLVYIG